MVERAGKGKRQGEKEAYANVINSGADDEREIRRVRYKAAKKMPRKLWR